MAYLTNLKFNKSKSFLDNKLQQQSENKKQVIEVISNINRLRESCDFDRSYLKDILMSGKHLLVNIENNIIAINILNTELDQITDNLHSVLVPKKGKILSRAFLLEFFKKLEEEVKDYSTKFQVLQKKLENDDVLYSTFMASCNLSSSYLNDDFSKKAENDVVENDATTDTDNESFEADETIESDVENVLINDELKDVLDNINDAEIMNKGVISDGVKGLIEASDENILNELSSKQIVDDSFKESFTNIATEYEDDDVPSLSQLNTKKNEESKADSFESAEEEIIDNDLVQEISIEENEDDFIDTEDTEGTDTSEASTNVFEDDAVTESVNKNTVTSVPFQNFPQEDTAAGIVEIQDLTNISTQKPDIEINIHNKEAELRENLLSKEKIEKVLKAESDNETLIISERNNKIYLPYKIIELDNYIKAYPSEYKDYTDVVKKEFILNLTDFMKHPNKSRFEEAYNLNRNKEGKSIVASILYGLKLSGKTNLSPAIIAACKSSSELDRYISCLDGNKLNAFKSFNIIYEINPLKET